MPGEQSSPQSPREVRQSCAAAVGLKEMRGSQGAASRASREQKQQGWNKRQRCPEKHKPGEMRAQSPLSPASFPQAWRGTKGAQFVIVPNSPSLKQGPGKHQLPPFL